MIYIHIEYLIGILVLVIRIERVNLKKITHYLYCAYYLLKLEYMGYKLLSYKNVVVVADTVAF